MTPDPDRDWKEILKRLAWYLWLALGPAIKAYLLTLDRNAAASADRDATNDLHKQP